MLCILPCIFYFFFYSLWTQWLNSLEFTVIAQMKVGNIPMYLLSLIWFETKRTRCIEWSVITAPIQGKLNQLEDKRNENENCTQRKLPVQKSRRRRWWWGRGRGQKVNEISTSFKSSIHHQLSCHEFCMLKCDKTTKNGNATKRT